MTQRWGSSSADGGGAGQWPSTAAAREDAPWSIYYEPDAPPAGSVTGESPPPPGEGAPPLAKPRRTRWWWASRALSVMLLAFFLLIGWLAFAAPISQVRQPIEAPQITLLAADGTPIARDGAVVEDPVDIADLPPHVVEALLAIEDRRFFSHWGVDPRGLARAVVSNLTGGMTQGGSTITQQLAKFTYLSNERSLTRKVKELLIAFWLEAWLSKDEILSRYLSNAYFGTDGGQRLLGLRAASLHYFYRQPENLLPEQAAMLAGLLQSPNGYAPTRNPERAAERFRLVKNAMVAAGYLTQAEADAMAVPALDVRNRGGDNLPSGTYFADWALQQARATMEVSYESQTLTTTLDSRLQEAARNAVARASLGSAQVALVAMRPNGEVVAMIGGRDYSQSAFNRATQARRQPGSTFKLFVYLAALRDGWGVDDPIDNTAITTGSYRPRNASGNYSETITLRDAFAQSSNVAAVRLLEAVGSEAVIATARDYGVTAEMVEGDPSLALGTAEMTLLELTSAYAGVAANSFPVEPHAFARGEPGWFDWLWNGQGSLGGGTHEDIEDMLRAAINSGTGRAAMLAGPNYGKTGTSQDNRDALFVGYAGEGENRLVVGVWIGNEDNSPLDGVTGGGTPARIWRDFMRAALVAQAPAGSPSDRPDPGGPVQPFDVPELKDIPLGGDATINYRDGEAGLQTTVNGVPVGMRVGPNGVVVDVDEGAAAARVERAVREEAAQGLRPLTERGSNSGGPAGNVAPRLAPASGGGGALVNGGAASNAARSASGTVTGSGTANSGGAVTPRQAQRQQVVRDARSAREEAYDQLARDRAARNDQRREAARTGT